MPRKKVKKCKNMRRCVCGCDRLCNGHDVIRVDCAIDYVKKLGYDVTYTILKTPLTPSQLKKQIDMGFK